MSDWQPIETAPKDGTPVLLWVIPENGHAQVRSAQFKQHKCGSGLWLLAESDNATLYLVAEQATHWRLPPPGPEST